MSPKFGLGSENTDMVLEMLSLIYTVLFKLGCILVLIKVKPFKL
jgi:hypothetical protein